MAIIKNADHAIMAAFSGPDSALWHTVDAVFLSVVGRPPTTAEREYWALRGGLWRISRPGRRQSPPEPSWETAVELEALLLVAYPPAPEPPPPPPPPPPGPTSLQALLDRASPGQAVEVPAGTYRESLVTTVSGLRLVANGLVVVTAPGRVLDVQHAGFRCDGFAFDGENGEADTVRVRADDSLWDRVEIRNSGRDGLDVGNVDGLLLTDSHIHHCHWADGDAHGVSGGLVRRLVIEDTEIGHVGGDCVQLDATRTPGAWDLTLDNVDFHDAGEDGVDTKGQGSLVVIGGRYRGFRGQTNSAAFNLKEEVSATIHGPHVSDAHIAFRLRHPAQVGFDGASIEHCDRGIRYEDGVTESPRTGVIFVNVGTEIERAGDQPAPPPPPPPPTGGGNAYFESLAARPDVLVAYPLRSQAELDQWKNGQPPSTGAVYDAAMDAARIIVPPGDGSSDANMGGRGTSHTIRMPIGGRSGETIVLTWDARWSQSYMADLAGLEAHKTFHLTSWNDNQWITVRTRYKDRSRGPSGTLAQVDTEGFSAGRGDPEFGPGSGPQGRQDRNEPQLHEFNIRPERWVRYLVEIAIDTPASSDWATVRMWVADEDTDPVAIYDPLRIGTAGAIDKFWLSFNSSQSRASGSGELVAWVRNLVVLRNPGDVSALLVRP